MKLTQGKGLRKSLEGRTLATLINIFKTSGEKHEINPYFFGHLKCQVPFILYMYRSLQGPISLTFYAQHLHTNSDTKNAKNTVKASVFFLRFWELQE